MQVAEPQVVTCITLGFRDAAYSWPLPAGKESMTAAQLKEELKAQAKLLYHQRLRFKLDGTVLEDSSELPLAPRRVEVGGPDSIVNMLEMHLQKGCEKRSLPTTLWQRLSRCGRLPICPPLPDAAMLLWLGDYAGARESCRGQASALDINRLREALAKFNSNLPGCTERSEAFQPLRADREETQRQLSLLDGGRLQTACGTYAASDSASIGYVLLSPPEDTPSPPGGPALLLHWGGNAEYVARTAASPLRELVKAGLVRALFLDYRGFGWSSGSASLVTLRGDANSLFLALPKLLLHNGVSWSQSGPIVIMGRSIGSLCALHVAALHADEIDAVILDSPVTCHWPVERVPPDAWNSLGKQLPPLQVAGRKLDYCVCCRTGSGAKKAQPGREAVWLDSMDLVRSIEVPLLVLSATEDDVCPPPMVKAIFAASASGYKKLAWAEGRCHDTVSLSATYWGELKGFLHHVVQRHHQQDKGASPK